MDQSHSIEIEFDDGEIAALEVMAHHEGHSLAELVKTIVGLRIEDHRAFVAAVEEGLADIRAGRTVSHEEMIAIRTEQRRAYLEQRHAAE